MEDGTRRSNREKKSFPKGTERNNGKGEGKK
jgi:hypothetical protein